MTGGAVQGTPFTDAEIEEARESANHGCEHEKCTMWCKDTWCIKYARWLATVDALRAKLAEAQKVADEQAEDEGCWFQAQTAQEAYLQQELRKLHAAIERRTHV